MRMFFYRSYRPLGLVIGGLLVLLLATGCVATNAPTTTAGDTSVKRPAASSPSSLPAGPATTSAAAQDVSSNQANSSIPGHRGVGAALSPDLDRAPVVPRRQKIEEYVAAFYEAVESKDWGRASAMVPPSEPGEGSRDFERRQQGFEFGTVSLFPSAMSEGKATVFAVLATPRHGVWHVTWRFLETPRGVVVRDLTYARPNMTG